MQVVSSKYVKENKLVSNLGEHGVNMQWNLSRLFSIAIDCKKWKQDDVYILYDTFSDSNFLLVLQRVIFNSIEWT